MGSLKMSLKRRLALEKELDRRAIQAGRAGPSPPPPKLSPVQASIAARKERTLASLGPKAGKAARQHMLDVEMEKERLALQLKREQLERQGEFLLSHLAAAIHPLILTALPSVPSYFSRRRCFTLILLSLSLAQGVAILSNPNLLLAQGLYFSLLFLYLGF